MNALIVDDEDLIRQKLVRLVSQPGLGFQNVWQASNAVDALEIFDREHPEIVLTDIRMPQRSGLDIARHVHETAPDHIVILLTGYSEFDYAKAGIDYRVFDYILKPIDTDKTLDCVRRGQRQFQQTQKRRSLYQVFQSYYTENESTIRRQFMESLLFHPFEQDETLLRQQTELFGLNQARYRLAVLQCVPMAAERQPEEGYYYAYFLEKYLQQDAARGSATYFSGDTVYLLYPVAEGALFEDNRRLTRRLQKAREYMEIRCPLSLHIGVSQPAGTLMEIKSLKKQAHLCLDYSMGHPGEEVVFYDDIASLSPMGVNIDDHLGLLCTHIRAGNRTPALGALKALLQCLDGAPEDYTASTIRLVVSNVTCLEHELGLDSLTIAGLQSSVELQILRNPNLSLCREYLTGWVADVCDAVGESFKNRNSQLLGSIMDYIAHHYSEPVGLAEAAKAVGRNPSYISRLVKQLAGKSFTRLLTERRVAEAKGLLEHTSLKVSQIAEQTGYPNVRYFNRIFSLHVGMTANDYRKVMCAFSE